MQFAHIYQNETVSPAVPLHVLNVVCLWHFFPTVPMLHGPYITTISPKFGESKFVKPQTNANKPSSPTDISILVSLRSLLLNANV